MESINAELLQLKQNTESNSTDGKVFDDWLVEWSNCPGMGMDSEGDIWSGNNWLDADKKREFIDWLTAQ